MGVILTEMTEGSEAAVSPVAGALTDEASSADAALRAVRLEAFTAALAVDFTAPRMVGSTVAAESIVAVAVSTAAAVEDSTVAAVEDFMAAVVDTGNREVIRSSPIR